MNITSRFWQPAVAGTRALALDLRKGNMIKVITILFLTMTFAIFPVVTNADGNTIQIESKQTLITPQINVLYTLTPPMIYETQEPGPKEENVSKAWKIANEFVFRTTLREQIKLPASTAIQHKTGVMVIFTQKDSEKKIHIFIRSDFKTIEYKE